MRLQWGSNYARQYAAGVDRGVLYLPDGAVPWDGLTAVREEFEGSSTKPYYYNGYKFYEDRVLGDYSGTVEALYYPPELEDHMGRKKIWYEINVHGQTPATRYGMSYRSSLYREGSSRPFGHVIHMIYNVMLDPQPLEHRTLQASTTPTPFSWKFTTIPIWHPWNHHEPTAHVTIDSRTTDPDIFRAIEDILYGNDTRSATLLTPAQIVDHIVAYSQNVDGSLDMSSILDGNIDWGTLLSGGTARSPYI